MKAGLTLGVYLASDGDVWIWIVHQFLPFLDKTRYVDYCHIGEIDVLIALKCHLQYRARTI